MNARPNILVILSDQMKATASHLYGNPFCQTPSLARLAEGGVLFRHAFTPHPLCVPARVSLWTGQWPHSTGARRNETWMPAGANHVFRLWHQEGYRCGLIGKNHCFEQAEDLALFDVWCEIGHRGLPDDPTTRGMEWVRPLDKIAEAHSVRRNMPTVSPRFSYAHTDFPLEDYATGLIAEQTVEFLRRFGDEPFALWVSIPDPHEPYEAPRRYAEMFPPDVLTLPPWREGEFRGDEVPERNKVLYHILGLEDDPLEDVYGVLAAYYGMVRFLDDGVGRILDALDDLGLRENTIVVFCTDHGDFSGEHCMTCKGGVFYDCLTRIPLIVSWPGHIPQGQVDESMVNLVDVVPTLLRLQGYEVPRSMHGQPLPTVTDADPREATFAEYGAGGPPFTLEHLAQLPQSTGRRALMHSLRWREAEGRRKMVRTARWKYVHDPMGDKDELYDLQNDPWELNNVVGDPANRDVLMEMRLRLADWSIQTEDAKPVPLPEPQYYDLRHPPGAPGAVAR
ncbi:MAG: sulfatase-like hydrolase/transferase [Chloroflexi bacterium]|nr:sulfatase-like hydrolase/transferase [Chloroflexota bacterium]